MVDFDINSFNPYVLHCGYLTRTLCPPAGTVYMKRKVKWYELELIEWGEGYVITEGKKLRATKGELFFRRPGMIVQGISPYSCRMIMFDGNYNKGNTSYKDNELFNWDDEIKHCSLELNEGSLFSDIPSVLTVKQYAQMEQLFSKAYDSFIFRSENTGLILKICILQILQMVLEEQALANKTDNISRSIQSNYHKVMQIKELIDLEKGWKLSLTNMAEIVNLSPNFFCRIFKDIVGETPVTYVNRCRINKARKLLIETDMSVKSIAIECGFENETYFYTLFKKLADISPFEFRSRNSLNCVTLK